MFVSDYSSGMGILGGILASMAIISIISLAISIIMIVSMWKIFAKNNKPGWYSLIPIINMWTLFELVGIKGWWSLIPFANIVYMYIANYKLPLQMGKDKTLAILNIFFPFVVVSLVFSSASSSYASFLSSDTENFCFIVWLFLYGYS